MMMMPLTSTPLPILSDPSLFSRVEVMHLVFLFDALINDVSCAMSVAAFKRRPTEVDFKYFYVK